MSQVTCVFQIYKVLIIISILAISISAISLIVTIITIKIDRLVQWEITIGKMISKSKQPVIGVDVKGILNRKNVIPVGKTIDAENETIITENQSIKDVKNIIWATGYRPNFNWIEGIELDKEGYPVHKRGVSNTNGLYFIGLPWLYTRGSATLGGIKKDADYLAEHISKASDLVPA